MDSLDAPDVFDLYRREVLAPPAKDANGWVHERVGPVVRSTTPAEYDWGGGIFSSDLAGLSGPEVDAVIAGEIAHFSAGGRHWEWKTYSRDVPADLEARLVAAGLVAGDVEALLIGDVDDVVAACSTASPPAGVTVREADGDDFAGIAALVDENWPDEAYGGEVARAVAAEKRTTPDLFTVLVAVAGAAASSSGRDGEQVVSAGWMRYHAGTSFAAFNGGNTRAAWRGRGIYTDLVRRRAERARSDGYRYLQVDASPDSRPILERLGLRQVATTTPYTWRPAGS